MFLNSTLFNCKLFNFITIYHYNLILFAVAIATIMHVYRSLTITLIITNMVTKNTVFVQLIHIINKIDNYNKLNKQKSARFCSFQNRQILKLQTNVNTCSNQYTVHICKYSSAGILPSKYTQTKITSQLCDYTSTWNVDASNRSIYSYTNSIKQQGFVLIFHL